MLRKLTYFLTTTVIKAKGIKKIFSQDPIDVMALRKDDVHIPTRSFFKQFGTTFDVLETKITAISTVPNPKELILFIHGGAFVSGPSAHHWDSLQQLAKQTGHSFWMCNYPKAPEHTIDAIMENIQAVYQKALTTFDSKNITLLGDSAGGTLSILLIQSLLDLPQSMPKQLIAICPVVDASMDNEEVKSIDPKDIMLSQKGVLSAKKMCLNTEQLKDKRISPIFGALSGFPKTTLFLATHDITFPDAREFAKKLSHSNAQVDVVIGEKMPHIWPLLPIMTDSKEALQKIVSLLKA